MKFDDEQYYDIPLDDHNVPYVTIEEMQEIYPNAKLDVDEQTGLYYTDYFKSFSYSLLLTHFYVELLMEKYDKIDWERVTGGYQKHHIEYIEHIFNNPLVWVDELPRDFPQNIAVVGKIAQEKSSCERNTCIPYDMFFFNMYYNERVLWFADHLPMEKDFADYNIYHADFISWDYLTEEIGCYNLHKDENHIVFDGDTFLRNIQFIAKHRGGAKAAEIVRKFREDWPSIAALKPFGINDMSDQQIDTFRDVLFAGMDRNMRKWETEEAETKEEKRKHEVECRYIDKDKLAETGIHTLENFMKMLRQASEQDAKTLGEFLRKYYKLGYLDFHGDSKKKIYEHLKACFPGAIKYSYTNFTLYFH